MSQAILSNNVSIKVSAAATAGMTVPANSYVVASYKVTGSANSEASGDIATLYFGPSQTVSSTIAAAISTSGVASNNQTYTFVSGVVFTNSP